MRGRAVVSTMLLCLLVAGCSQSSGGSGRRPDPSIAVGRRLFSAARCGACHALRSVGARGGSGPDFDRSERLSRSQLRAALTEGANGMPSYARLGRRPLDALAAFLDAVMAHR